MNTISTIRNVLGGALLAACLPALAIPALAAGTTAAKHAHATQPMPAALRPVFYQALAKDAGAAYHINKQGCATLPKQKLKACFDRRGAHFTGTVSLVLRLEAYGRGHKLGAVQAVKPKIEGNQASYRHGTVTEWWRVLPMGFEQGFTIAKRPAGDGPLTLTLAASRQGVGAPSARHSRAGGNPAGTSPSIPLRSEGGNGTVSTGFRVPLRGPGMTKKKNDGTLAWGKLRYGQLVVTDAKGKTVPATLKSKGNRVLIAVNDAHAVYPLTVDPLVWLEQKVTASDGSAQDSFGSSVALDGATALVGADFATINGNIGQGAAYVFRLSGGIWTQTAKLTASDGVAFGISVALSGSTALVGADHATVDGNNDEGAAYVFSESDGSWSQTQKLTASDGAASDRFGFSVALSGTTALVGAFLADIGGNSDQGATYMFNESGGSWNETQKLTASDGAASDNFGLSVALDGTTAFVGAPGATVNGNSEQGAAYVFGESGGSWSETQKLTASDGMAGDVFGISVALSGTTALVGAYAAPVNDNLQQGAAYVFDESGGTWTQTQKLAAGDGAAGDDFGISVALSGTTALVGARYATVNGNVSQGAAYVFSESGGSWSQTQKLTASDGAAEDEFGESVALAGATALVGVKLATVNGNTDQGAAYFARQGTIDLLTTAPPWVYRYVPYLVQAIATNEATMTSPAVAVTAAVPAGAVFLSALSSQGTCGQAAGIVTCNFGSIGPGGFAYANVILSPTADGGSTIENTASVVSIPALSDSASSTVHPCGANFLEYTGTLAPGTRYRTPAYESAAGRQTVIVSAPAGFALHAGYRRDAESPWQIRWVPLHAVYHYGPAGTYRWQINAGADGGDYTLCIKHP